MALTGSYFHGHSWGHRSGGKPCCPQTGSASHTSLLAVALRCEVRFLSLKLAHSASVNATPSPTMRGVFKLLLVRHVVMAVRTVTFSWQS